MGRKKNIDKTQIFELEDASKPSLATEKQAGGEAAQAVQIKENKPKVRGEKKKVTRGKRYLRAWTLVEKNKIYPLEAGIDLCKKVSTSKFDGSLELHLNLNLDIKAEQKVRAATTLPHGTGKEVRIMAFVSGENEKTARAAGADSIGNDKTIEDLFNGQGIINFDKVVATPDFMPKLAKVAKILGPKGLMPSPKNGTVSTNPEKAIREIKKGKLEIKNEANAPIVHLSLGKLSFSLENLKENFLEVIRVIKEAKPAKVSGDFIKSANLSPTMGPSVKIDLSPFK